MIKAGLLGHFHRPHRLGAVVHPPERLQMWRIKTLNTDGQTINTQLTVSSEFVRLKGAGVAVEGNFNIRGETQALSQSIKQDPVSGRREQTGRAAAKENTVNFPALH